jgi:hypothetical protein
LRRAFEPRTATERNAMCLLKEEEENLKEAGGVAAYG